MIERLELDGAPKDFLSILDLTPHDFSGSSTSRPK